MLFNVFILIVLLMLVVWPISIYLGIRSNLRFVDAFSHLALPGVLILFLLTGFKSISLILFFVCFVYFLNRYFNIKDHKNLDVELLSFSSIGLVGALFILKLLPKNWHIDSDVLLFGNFDVFYLNKIAIFEYDIPLIFLILICMAIVNYSFLYLYLPTFLKGVLYKNENNYNNIWLISLVSLNLILLFYLMGAFLLLGLFSLPLLLAFVVSKSFRSYLFNSLILPIIFAPFLFLYFLKFDFSISLTLIISLFFLFLLSFLLCNVIKVFNK